MKNLRFLGKIKSWGKFFISKKMMKALKKINSLFHFTVYKVCSKNQFFFFLLLLFFSILVIGPIKSEGTTEGSDSCVTGCASGRKKDFDTCKSNSIAPAPAPAPTTAPAAPEPCATHAVDTQERDECCRITYYGDKTALDGTAGCARDCGIRTGDDTSSSETACREANTTFSESHNKFSEACVKANMSTSGATSCFRHLERCEKCQTDLDDTSFRRSTTRNDFGVDIECKPVSEDDRDLIDFINEEEESTESLSETLSIFSNRTSEAQRVREMINRTNRFSNCPAIATEGLEDAREKLDEAREQVQESEENVTRIKGELLELRNTAKRESERVIAEAEQIKTDLEREAQALRQQIENSKNEISNQILELKDKVAQTYDIDQEIALSESEARNAHRQELRRIKDECHNAALEQANQRRGSILEASMNSSFQGESALSVLQSAGLSSSEESERFIQEYSAYCESDPNILRAIQSTKTVLDEKLARFASEKMKNERIRQRLNDQVASLEPQVIASEKRLIDQILAAHTRAEQQLNQKNRELTEMTRNYDNLIQLKEEELAQAERRLRAKQDYLQRRQHYITAAERFSNGEHSIEVGSVTQAMTEMHVTRTKAVTAMNSCKCCEATKIRGNACAAYRGYLTQYYNSDDVDLCSTDNISRSDLTGIETTTQPTTGTQD